MRKYEPLWDVVVGAGESGVAILTGVAEGVARNYIRNNLVLVRDSEGVVIESGTKAVSVRLDDDVRLVANHRDQPPLVLQAKENWPFLLASFTLAFLKLEDGGYKLLDADGKTSGLSLYDSIPVSVQLGDYIFLLDGTDDNSWPTVAATYK